MKTFVATLVGLALILSTLTAFAEDPAKPEPDEELDPRFTAMIELVTNIHRCLSTGGDVYITLDPTPNEANRARFECRPRTPETKS
jgi:hypothetical protein